MSNKTKKKENKMPQEPGDHMANGLATVQTSIKMRKSQAYTCLCLLFKIWHTENDMDRCCAVVLVEVACSLPAFLLCSVSPEIMSRSAETSSLFNSYQSIFFKEFYFKVKDSSVITVKINSNFYLERFASFLFIFLSPFCLKFIYIGHKSFEAHGKQTAMIDVFISNYLKCKWI